MKTKKSTKDEAKTEVKPKRKYKTKAKRKYERKANKPEAVALISRAEWQAGMTRKMEEDMRLLSGFVLGVFSPMLKEMIQEEVHSPMVEDVIRKEVKAALAQLKAQGQGESSFSPGRWSGFAQGDSKRGFGSFSS